jgi:hypothetical protein
LEQDCNNSQEQQLQLLLNYHHPRLEPVSLYTLEAGRIENGVSSDIPVEPYGGEGEGAAVGLPNLDQDSSQFQVHKN